MSANYSKITPLFPTHKKTRARKSASKVNKSFSPIIQKMATMTIDVPVDYQSKFQDHFRDVTKMVCVSKSLEIAADDDLEAGLNMAGEMRKLSKRIDAIRKEVNEPAREFINRVNAFAETFTDTLNMAVSELTSKIGRYQKAKEADHLARIQEELLLAQACGMESPKDLLVAPRVHASGATTYERTAWEIEAVDLALVPAQYLMVNESAVRAAIKAGLTEIPGLRITEQKVTTLRAK